VYRGTHLQADFETVAVAVEGQPVRLTRREFDLLQYLVQNRNRVVSRDRLLERVWGYERVVETRSVDVHVGRLRHKLGTAGRQIETVVGLGYRFVDA
jgi:two-component system alkaline phosphatase synthesis response regulator PhoP